MKFGFYSCMSGMPWGGSEVLWYKAARTLQDKGHQVAVNFKWWPYKAFQLEELERRGGEVFRRGEPRNNLKRVQGLFNKRSQTPAGWLEATRPDAVLVTLGYHPDPVDVATACLESKIPYAINVQCASSFCFIAGSRVEQYRQWYRHAEKVYFVSQENLEKTQNNLAMRLDNAVIVANPFNVQEDADPPWPEPNGRFRLAVVGRIHFQSKGQDLVVDVMKSDKWRQRPVDVVFYGHDQGNQQQLNDLIAMHGLEDQLKIGGFQKDVTGIWANHHALLLPSRYEGAPLIVIESMLCNRLAITTNLGRNDELMDDNESGFIAEGATVRLLDDALERAWAKRDQWREIGQLAGQHIRARYSMDPVGEYADHIEALVKQ